MVEVSAKSAVEISKNKKTKQDALEARTVRRQSSR